LSPGALSREAASMHSNHHIDAALAASRQTDLGAGRRAPERAEPYRVRATIRRWISFVPS